MMPTFAPASRAAPAPAKITWDDDVVVVRDAQVFSPGGEDLCERFCARVRCVKYVRVVSLDRLNKSASIFHGASRPELGAFLASLSAAIRNEPPAQPGAPSPRGIGADRGTMDRHGALVTTWEILSVLPGRVHLRHQALRSDPALAREVARRAGQAPGVWRVSRGVWTSSLFIHHDPNLIDVPRLLALLDEAVDSVAAWADLLPKPPRTRFALANGTLGTAVLGEFVTSAATPVCAVLLVGTNLRTFQAAWLQLRARQFGLPVLYTAIVTTALASGQFLSCAVMSLCYKFWEHRLGLELAAERRRLLQECLPRSRSASLITKGGTELLVPLDRLRPGDRVVAGAGESVPADGRVIGGEAIVDERSVSGREGAMRKTINDRVLAGSTVLAGRLRVEVDELEDRTRAARIARALIAATSVTRGPTSQTRRARVFADRAVAPTLATAGVGLLIGDLTTAAAILPPDYASGPGLAVPLELLKSAALCARQGVVLCQSDVFERLFQLDLFVLEDDPAFSRLELEVTSIQTGIPEAELLRYAASAFRHLADNRAAALASACRSRQIHLLDLPPVDFSSGVTVLQGRRRIAVRDSAPVPDGSGALVVELDETPVGLIEFGRSSRPESAAALWRIRDLTGVPIVLVSSRSEADVAATARLLGVDMHQSALGPGDCARFLRHCRERGLRAAYIGRCARQAAAADEAHLAISLAGSGDEAPGSAAVLLLQPRLELLADLLELAREYQGRVRDAQTTVLVPNVFCVAGAFLFGFTSLVAVTITNLATLGIYTRAAGSLRELTLRRRDRSIYASPS
jgi:Cu2+-exporting ATPase